MGIFRSTKRPEAAHALSDEGRSGASGSSDASGAGPAAEAQSLVAGRELNIAPEADENWFEHERAVERGLVVPPATRGGARFKPDDVGWSGDDNNPEYGHLDLSLGTTEFSFGPKELELIIRASRFEPSRSSGVILFGIRGAELIGGSQLNKDGIRLRDVRPDHRAFRCVIGAYHVGRQQVSAFTGSTVPNTNAVYTNWARHQSGAAPYGNMLLSGCYRYRVGTHVGTHEVPGAFRLQEDAEVVVLRSNADVTYDTGDVFDRCVPHDNLHPALRSMSFSSAGCQTVRGTYNAEQGHTGEWAEFRKAVGLKGAGDNGKRFDYVLVTGLEAAIAARTLADPATARDETAIRARLTRLRYGSRGAEVSALQAALKRPATGFLDAGDRIALADLQRQKLGFADATYSPAMDAKLGLGVFAADEVVALAPTRSLAPAEAERIALVIGNGAYHSAGARLANPPNDAEAIAAELDKLGFKVTRLIDKTRAEMAEAIATFIERLDNPQVNAEAGLVFYAGHGVQIDGENYLLPVDCSPRSSAALVDSAIGLDAIIRALEKSKKAGLVFLDCCRNNPFPKATRAFGGGLAGIDAPAGTFIAYATAPGSVALDGEDTPNSPFTSSLIAHVPAEGLSVSQMMIRVRRDVFQKSGGQQMPWDSSSLLVDLSLNPTPVTRSRQKPVSPEDLAKRRREEATTKEAEAWELTSRSNSEQLLRSFITMYPYSRHRADAVRRLRWLRAKDRFFWAATAAAAVFLLVVALGVVQWFRFEKTAADNVDLVGGDVGVVLADLKLNPVDTSLPWCRLRCVLSPFTCKAYTYNHASKRCFIKNDLLFQITGDAAKGSTSAYLWGYKAPVPSPFKIQWNQMFESGDAILPNGEPAPIAVTAPRNDDEAKLDADYNAWGKTVADLVGPWKGNSGIVCQRLCFEQEKCVGFTFNAVFERCRLFRWIRQNEEGNPRMVVVPHYSQPDEASKMKLSIPLVFSGIYPQRNK